MTTNAVISQSWRGIYKKKSCFCDNHSNSKGLYLGAGVYGSKLSLSNDLLNDNTIAQGFGGFVGYKLKDQYSIRLGAYMGNVQPVTIAESGRDFPAVSYRFKHLNIPLSLIYKFRSEKRISPYLLIGGEANLLRETTAFNDYNSTATTGIVYNQVNIVLGAGSYILFGDHFGLFLQASMDMNPFSSELLSNYNYAFTGKAGLTYHF